jgi:DNA-binding transcriptional ArsR family regulator
MLSLEVDWAPAYELSISLDAFLSTRNHKLLDLGPSWVRDVRASIGPAFSAELTHNANRAMGDLAFAATRHSRRDLTVDEFLASAAALSVDDLIDFFLKESCPRDNQIPANLRESWAITLDLLHRWNDAYFRHIDPAILTGLAAEAAARRTSARTSDPMTVIEDATHGVCFEGKGDTDAVLLIPQWHYRPWNLYGEAGIARMFQYPADVLPTHPDDPPQSLLRLSRALGDESRLRILRSLAEGPRSFSDLVRSTKLSKSTVNHHMVMLRAAGLVTFHDRRGKGDTYTLRSASLDALDAQLRSYLHTEDSA